MIFIYVIVLLTFIAIISTIGLRFLFPHRISNKEMAISIVLSFAVSAVCVLITLGNVYNTELLHGKVTNKYKDIVSCEHSNRVCTGSGENETCITTYDHFYDNDWVVDTTVGRLRISRIDRQGLREPPRFTTVEIGEPATVDNMYIDYIRGSNSIFNTRDMISTEDYYFSKVPRYPETYDYYRANLVLSTDPVDNKIIKDLNSQLREKLKTLGYAKQNSTIIVLTKESQAFAEYLKSYWNNGRKNNGIVVIGFNDKKEITWVDVFGWSTNEMYKVSLQTDILRVKTIDNTKEIVDNIAVNTSKYFERKPMGDFNHLLFDREISILSVLLVIFLQLGINVGLSFYNYRSVENTCIRNNSKSKSKRMNIGTSSRKFRF